MSAAASPKPETQPLPSTTTDPAKAQASAATAPALVPQSTATPATAREAGEDPKYLLPKMGGDPVSEPAVYRSLYILDTVDTYQGKADAAASKKELNGPVDPFSDKDLVDETKRKPAVGALMVHSQAWEQSGLSLGNLLQSVCLAPGEVTRVAVIDWRRRETGTSVETTQQAEAVSSDIEQQRAVNEVQRAVASEAQSGNSQSFASSVSAQGGASISTLFASANFSAAANATTALTAQFSAGTRNLAASATNAISQRTAEKSQSLRSARQSVVKELSQQESEQISSRILANYNRRHSLNVEYFEVLQRYSIKTRLVGWERCLFVPLMPLDFSKPEILQQHQADLIAIVKQLGAGELATRILEALGNLTQADADRKKDLAQVQTQMDLIGQAIGAAVAGLSMNSPESVPNVPNYAAAFSAMRTQYNTLQQQLAGFGVKIPTFDDARSLGAGPVVTTLQTAVQTKNAEYQRKLTSYTIPLGEVLNTSQLFLSQQIWLRMDSYRIYRVLEPYQIGGKSLTSLVDPHPVGLFGNYLAFRWGFGRDDAGKQDRDRFEKMYLQEDDSTTIEATVALPTSGVFAEAVLGRGEAAEVIDEKTYGTWAQNQPPILPPDIAALQSRDRARDMNLNAQGLAAALAQLRATPVADASYIGNVLGQVSKGDMFRNMGGLEQALSLSEKLAEQSGAGATRAGDRAAEMQAKMLDTLVDVLNSDVGKAAAAEFVLPGAGPALMGLGGGGGGGSHKSKAGAGGGTGSQSDSEYKANEFFVDKLE